jgi:hypothetical protein
VLCLPAVRARLRDDIADPATWIGLITVIARDDVDVQVRNRLPGGRSAVEADVVTIRCGLQGRLQVISNGVDQFEHSRLFGR